MNDTTLFELKGADGRLIRGDRLPELILKTGDHRLSSPENLDTFRRLVMCEF